MASIRRITGQQFSDGTTIDGDRLEKALQDLEDYINDVPDGDFKSRWTQSQLVCKLLPWSQNADVRYSTDTGVAGNHGIKLPWMPVYNPSTLSGIPTVNRARFKGNKLPYQFPIYQSNPGYSEAQVAWTTAIAVGKDPLVIDAVDAVLAAYSSVFVNDWVWGSSAPNGKTPGEKIDNIHLVISMDNPFLPGIQSTNSILFHKYDFNISSAQSIADAISVPSFSADMVPNLLTSSAPAGTMGTGLTTTMRIREEDLKIPVPPYSKLRFSLILPDDNFDPWGTKPWQTMIPTMSLTFLERLESD